MPFIGTKSTDSGDAAQNVFGEVSAPDDALLYCWLNFFLPTIENSNEPFNPLLLTTVGPISSELAVAPMSLVREWQRGRAGTFRGGFGCVKDGTAFKDELGINYRFYVEEWTDGPPESPFFGSATSNKLLIDLTSGGVDTLWRDPRDLADHIQGQLDAYMATGLPSGLGLNWQIRYLDEREPGYEDAPIFRFRIDVTHATLGLWFRLYSHGICNSDAVDDNGLSTVALHQYDTDACNGIGGGGHTTALGTALGDRVIHVSDWLIFDTGGRRLDTGGSASDSWNMSLDEPSHFILQDCNFSAEPAAAQFKDIPAAPNNSTAAMGRPKLVLYASDSAADIQVNIWDNAKFVEGKNKWTFVDDIAPDKAAVGDPTVWQGVGVWGSDSFFHPQLGSIETAQGFFAVRSGGFPARKVVADLRAWYDDRAPGGNRPNTTDYRYWRIQWVDRGNSTGRLRVGIPFLGPAFFFEGANPASSSYDFGVQDFSEVVRGRRGSYLSRRREPAWRVGATQQFITERDHWLLQSTLLSPSRHRLHLPTGTGALGGFHPVMSDPVTQGGGARPIFVIDTVYNPLAGGDEDPVVKYGQAAVDKWRETELARGLFFGFWQLDTARAERRSDLYTAKSTLVEIPRGA